MSCPSTVVRTTRTDRASQSISTDPHATLSPPRLQVTPPKKLKARHGLGEHSEPTIFAPPLREQSPRNELTVPKRPSAWDRSGATEYCRRRCLLAFWTAQGPYGQDPPKRKTSKKARGKVHGDLRLATCLSGMESRSWHNGRFPGPISPHPQSRFAPHQLWMAPLLGGAYGLDIVPVQVFVLVRVRSSEFVRVRARARSRTSTCRL